VKNCQTRSDIGLSDIGLSDIELVLPSIGKSEKSLLKKEVSNQDKTKY
jgi:hypothetical protein